MTGTTKLEATPVELGFEQHRTELTAYCYRMLGSAFEAEDAVQETLVRAWRSFDGFEGRSAVRSWLYRIASNVCFDMLKGRRRRALPMDLMDAGSSDMAVPSTTSESMWVGPVPDSRVIPAPGGDPALEAETRESVRLAFVAALQHLPPRQRAVLILREVLKWKASEVAELLDTTVVSVNSALQRARSTLADRNVTARTVPDTTDAEQQDLLDRYVDAFERFDIDSLVKLLHEDATMSMPPYPMWLRGADEYAAWMRGPGSECRGSRLAAISVNGTPGFAQWRANPSGGYDAWAIHVLDVSGGRIAGFDFFVDESLFPLFGLPIHLDA
ncbi:MAG TPA: sigma-70 family RNA polymerase sigma factor [Acidimicrobiia bacterium]|jgi:RNA polymerase sigma-70 factor (ECF subfamily)|nr:sigma-70 family RNA polymerase sigma factor [Acidimicrobiia bacterium]